MNDDERALLIAQSIIYAGLMIAQAVDQNVAKDKENVRVAQITAHLFAQNLDLGSGKP